MSDLGHFRTWRIVLPESVVRSKADISQALPMTSDLGVQSASLSHSQLSVAVAQRMSVHAWRSVAIKMVEKFYHT
jgi:hypothetical protein